MTNNNYLGEKEQYKKVLNNEEISRIVDSELRDIRMKYWNLLRKTFLDEHKIPDSMLGKEFDIIKAAEAKELDEYRKRNYRG